MPECLSVQLTRAIRRAFQQSLEHRVRSPSSETTSQWTCRSCHTRSNQFRPFSNRPTVYGNRADHARSAHKRLSSNAAPGQSAATKVESSRQTNAAAPTATTSAPLPSHTERQRWDVTKRWSSMMDGLLARASIAGQHINVYTGTDYSGIEALRNEIKAKENEVRTQHVAVSESKEQHTRARAKQSASQKEIVGLLERKSSWTPSDLERYMTLVRSEHVDDQAVQKAAEEMIVTERRLEATRSLLEKLERQQYHEEQIWSDTIRRNSTWVTIGLMGINIVLLLAQISVFEPYRRRKIVDQIEQALEQRVAAGVLLSTAPSAEPELTPLAKNAEPVLPEHGQRSNADESLALSTSALDQDVGLDSADTAAATSAQGLVARVQTTVHKLFGEEIVSMREYDRTLLAVGSAVSGMAVASGLSMFLLRSG